MKQNKMTVKMLRASKNATQYEVAKDFAVSPQCYARWENEPFNIKVKNAMKIAEYYGVSLNDIDWARS